MPFWRSYAHLIWATKERNAFIVPNIENRLHSQMIKKTGDLGCHVYAINGMPDHIHLVMAIPPKISVADVVKALKGSSSHFVNQVLKPPEFYFAWQRGYGYLSLGQKQLPDAIAYVERQKEHHRQETWHPWLEQYAELDDGPDIPTGEEGVVREASAPYWVDEGWPF